MQASKFKIGPMPIDHFDKVADQIDCNPIHQRLSRDDDKFTKSRGIINTLLNGLSIGQITLHQLPENHEYRYESIDGGHRKRAIIDFLDNKFSVKLADGKEVFWRDFSDEDREGFRKIQLSFCIYDTLDSVEVGNIFRVLNTITEISDQEILNSYGNHPIANAVRQTVRQVPSVTSTYHSLFESTTLKTTPYTYWHRFDNNGLRQDEWVARLFYRYYKGGGVGEADAANLRVMYDDAALTVQAVDVLTKKVHKLLSFVHVMAQQNKRIYTRGLSHHEATLFARLYLSLEYLHKVWDVRDSEQFFKTVLIAHTQLSQDPQDENSPLSKAAPRDTSMALWAWYKAQFAYHKSTDAAVDAIRMLLEKLDIESLIITKDNKRAYSRSQRETKLALQNFTCAETGQELIMENAHADHIIPWSKGGKTIEQNLQMITAEANREKSNKLI